MSDFNREIPSSTVPCVYSPFWALVLGLGGLAIWCGFQLVQLESQRSVLKQQYENLAPSVVQAQNAQSRLISLIRDLATTAKKDPNAAQIVKEVTDAGIVRQARPAADATKTTAPAPAQ